MVDPDPLEEIIREIATRHGIAVSRDDPILILQTINNRLMLNSAKAQAVLLDRYKENLEMQASRWANDAKERSERVLIASLQAGKEAYRDLVNEGLNASAARVRTEVEEIMGGVACAVRSVRQTAVFNLIAACLTSAAAAVALWTIYVA